MTNNTPTIDEWSDVRVTFVYSYYLDDMHPLDAVKLRGKHTTINEKREFLKAMDKKYNESFK